MKIIISRKGFDSGSGGFASPILPDGALVSIPIPDEVSDIKYKDVRLNNSLSYYDIISSLSPKIKISDSYIKMHDNLSCHLDPDLLHNSIERKLGWRGAFGQIRAAQTHLENEKVDIGDIFLFFGWFRQTHYHNNKLIFDSNDKAGRHIIFGYMQIAEIINVQSDTNIPDWLKYHPHNSEKRKTRPTNTIYIAREHLSWNKNIPGYGTFDYHKSLVLSKEGYTRTKWQLPEFFKEASISYHNDKNWKDDYFQSVSRGQEFVVHENQKVESWTKLLIEMNCKAI